MHPHAPIGIERPSSPSAASTGSPGDEVAIQASTRPRIDPADAPFGPQVGASSELSHADSSVIRGAVTARSVVLTPDTKALNASEADERAARFFAEPEPAQGAADLREAARLIDHGLQAKGDHVPPAVRELMVEMLARSFTVDRALTYGLGNEIVRRPTSDGLPGEPDWPATFEKSRLLELGFRCYEEVKFSPERPLQLSAKLTAIGLLLGIGSCTTSTHMFLLKLATVLQRTPYKDKVSVQIFSMPRLTPDGARVDHSCGELRYTSAEGEEYRISFDASADAPRRVKLARHSTITCSFPDDGRYLRQVNDDTATLVMAHMKVAKGNLDAARDHPLYAQKLQHRESAALAQWRQHPDAHFGLTHPLADGLYDGPFGEALPGVDDLPVARASAPARNSPLMSRD